MEKWVNERDWADSIKFAWDNFFEWKTMPFEIMNSWHFYSHSNNRERKLEFTRSRNKQQQKKNIIIVKII